MPTDNIPTAALPIIHDLNVVRVDVRMSALEPGLRTLVEKLSQDLHVARADLATSREARDEYLEELNEIRHLLGAGPGVTALEAVKARREAQAETRGVAEAAVAGPGVTALEAVKARREAQAETRGVAEAAVELLNEVRAALGVGEGDLTTEAVKRVVRERDEAREALAKANASLEIERIAGRVATEFWQARIATLETAIRDLAKVLP